ncbi:MAG: methyltransferase domain-containing protein [Burkholderiales bacterium]|jgi:SAM-dependent methyltransferase|nr:methyltransferase domain-containing protein [Burkholderiales bacterium]
MDIHSGTANYKLARAGWETPLARYLLAQEERMFERAITNIFGYYAIQIGLPHRPMLAQSRIPNKFVLDFDLPADVRADPHALPFPAETLDLIAMPHALEFTDDPHDVLREAHRALRAEGHLLIAGFNPYSLLGLRRKFGTPSSWLTRVMSPYRVKDWLEVLGFEIAGGAFSGYVFPFSREPWLSRFQWMEKAGDRWFPLCGGLYFLHAVKKVFGVRCMTPVWKREKRRRNWVGATAKMSQSKVSGDQNPLGEI